MSVAPQSGGRRLRGVDPPNGDVPQSALLEAINAARAAGATRCRVLCALGGRVPVPEGVRAPGGLEPSPALGATSSSLLWDPECPRCLQSRLRAGRAGGRAPGPHTPHRTPGVSPPVPPPEPRLCPAGSPRPPEVPPNGSSAATTSGPCEKWLRHHRVSWGKDRERDRPGRGQLGAGGGPEQGQPFLRRGRPCPVPLGLCGKGRSLSVPGVPCLVPGRGAGGTSSSEPRGRPVPATPSRSSAVMANHLRFVGRTVMVQNGNVEAAYGVLNR